MFGYPIFKINSLPSVKFFTGFTEKNVNRKVHKTKKASRDNQEALAVGAARFELTTSWSQTRRDTGLRYAPKFFLALSLDS